MRKLVLLVTLIGMERVLAQPLDAKDVPDPLKAWTNWVLRGSEETRCPPLPRQQTLAAECLWPARLELEVTAKGGVFRLRAHRYAPGFVALPGSERLWPLDVHVSGKPVPVVPQQGVPAVETPAGDISVNGTFVWDSPPASLSLPTGTALVRLTV